MSPGCSSAASTHPRWVQNGCPFVDRSIWCAVRTSTKLAGIGFLNNLVTARFWNCPEFSSKAVTTSPTRMLSMGLPSINVPAGKHSSVMPTLTRLIHDARRSARPGSVSTLATFQSDDGLYQLRPSSSMCSSTIVRITDFCATMSWRIPTRASAMLICPIRTER